MDVSQTPHRRQSGARTHRLSSIGNILSSDRRCSLIPVSAIGKQVHVIQMGLAAESKESLDND